MAAFATTTAIEVVRSPPHISVVIPTRNRADLLRRVLESYTHQSVSRDAFEIILVDDGSTDHTGDVCHALLRRLPLSYVRIEHAGLPAAKNVGLAAARGRMILFADDDDLAHPGLVAEHLRVHGEEPGQIAVLGYATWHPALRVTELMHFVTDVGRFLSAYPDLRHGQVLDFHYFWGGRVSVNRDFLLASGGFDEQMVALEDIEFGYRLSVQGLRIVFTRRAVGYMLRGFDFDGFCLRCERTGRALARFRSLHPGPVVDEYETTLLGPRAKQLRAVAHGSEDQQEAAAAVAQELRALRPQVLSLEARLETRARLSPTSPLATLSPTRRRLYRLYDDSFRKATLKGALAADEGR